MSLSPREARRFLAAFADAERADREERKLRGASPERSIALAQSLIETARRAAGDRPLSDPLRTRGEEAVREVWSKLHVRMRR